MAGKSQTGVALELEKKATEMRIGMVEMLRDSVAGGHYGGSMSVMDILTVLYFNEMNIDPKRPEWEDRDRLVLSKGHACCALCPILAEKGFFSKGLLNTFNKLDSPFGMHPDMNKIVGCDMSTGALGHGSPIATGMAIAAKHTGKKYRSYCVLSDGEMAEGSCWESFLIAAHYGLDNLCVVIDRNRFSCDGRTEGKGGFGEFFVEGTLCLDPLDKKMESFGWHTITCSGHDIPALLNAFAEAKETKGKPTAIVADTVKGKGVSFIEDKGTWHYGQFNEEQTNQAMEELNSKLKSLN